MEKFDWAPENQMLTKCKVVFPKGINDNSPLVYFPKIENDLTKEQKIAIVDVFGEYPYSYVEHLNEMFKHDLDEGVIKSKIEKTWGGIEYKCPSTNSIIAWMKRYDTQHAFYNSCREPSVFELRGFGYIKPRIGSNWNNTVKTEYGYNLPYSGNPGASILDQMCNHVLQKLYEMEVKYFNEHDERTVLKLKCRKEVRDALLWANRTLADFIVNDVENDHITIYALNCLLAAEMEVRDKEKEQAEILKARFAEEGLS